MKIADFKKVGNVVRFYYTTNDIDYRGDNWNLSGYEQNAGAVHHSYIRGFVDVAFDINHVVMEPCNDTYKTELSPFSKNDLKAKKVPCIIVVDKSVDKYFDATGNDFLKYSGRPDVVKFYLGDDIKVLDDFNVLKRSYRRGEMF